MNKKPDYTRIRDRLVDANGVVEKFPSISAAKQRSRHLQGAGKIVRVDRSEDPVAKPLNFGRKHRSVTFSEQRRIEKYNEKQKRIQERRKISDDHVDIIRRRWQVAP